ncbi:HlyD family type I secretion periplasmic adaptor subunit [Sphingomonas quercus]|uniref:Membrane fusion protein (MFP) family protein n=1 Tax=Sphingomonas quercus TaxID=2842451 RepID=A0ABS6BFB3_9SPHN|nr:HlyD family type I secretion periplasmic adaptor subunit [Sphingomonas quercus]MBU3076988.1 HlyD family type I secretion periplasmic adaptor subunit [Sphingomonas quercus]
MNMLHDIDRLLRRRQPADEMQHVPGFTEVDITDGEIARLQLRRPIVAGSLVVLVLVFGLLLWAAIASISGAVVAPGIVRVEGSAKTLKHREGGTIRRILVREGQAVKAGQLLIQFDRVQAQAARDIYQSAYDSAEANLARFQAEAANAAQVDFPADLLARQSDPNVGMLLAGQRTLFASRMTLYRSQAAVLSGQAQQLETQIQGLQAQAAAVDSQGETIIDELQGVRELARDGYAPKTRLLALERSAAGIKGQRGQITSDIGRTRQAIGEIRLQIAQLDDKRQTDAADGIRQAQERLTDAGPKVRAAVESLAQTEVRAPVSGHVFNLTQFTEGGVAGPTETLLQIVPEGTKVTINTRVRPNDIASVRVGLPADVTLTAYNPRTTPPVRGHVTLVAPDATSDEATHESYYNVRVSVDPGELARAGPDVRMTPGMPAVVNIVTGSRTILDWLLGPMTEAMRTAMRER